MGAPFLYEKVCKRRKCAKSYTTTVRGQQYCTPRCATEAYKERGYRPARPVPPSRAEEEAKKLATIGRGIAREQALKRVLVACEACGRLHLWAEMDVHHLDGDPNNNPPDGSNHAVLCQECHARCDVLMRAWVAGGKVGTPPDVRPVVRLVGP